MWEPVNQMSDCISFIKWKRISLLVFFPSSPFFIHFGSIRSDGTNWREAITRIPKEIQPKWILNVKHLKRILPWKITYFNTPNDTREMLKRWNASAIIYNIQNKSIHIYCIFLFNSVPFFGTKWVRAGKRTGEAKKKKIMKIRRRLKFRSPNYFILVETNATRLPLCLCPNTLAFTSPH